MSASRRVSPKTLGSLCVAVVVVATIVWTLVSSPSGNDGRPTVDQRPAKAYASPAFAQKSPQIEAKPKGACRDTNSQLPTRTVCFLESWYLLKPDDTTATKRQRIAPFAAKSFMREHSLVVLTSTEADKARISKGITVQASVNPDSIAEPFNHDNPEEGMDVSSQVVIWSSDEDGKMVGNYHTVIVQTMWQQIAGEWKLIWLEELSDTG